MYENLKVLWIKSLYFKLPEDFSGGLSDALRLMADYHDEVKNSEKHEMESSEEMDDSLKRDETDNIMWNKFLDIVDEGRRLTGILSMSEFEDDGSVGGRMKIMKGFDTK